MAVSLMDFLPKQQASTKSKTTETTQTQLSEEAINEIIRNMMESDQGLANIMTAQAGKGLYNSSTAQLLANDLASRVAGKAALASAPTTRTTKQRGSNPAPGGAVDPKYALGMQLVGELVGKLFGGKDGAQSNMPKQGGMFGAFDPIMASIRKQLGGGSDQFEAYTGNFGFDPSSFDLGTFSDYGNMGGYSNAGYDNLMYGFGGLSGADSLLSYGLGGGGYSYDPYSLTAGGSYSFGDYGSPSYSYDFGTNYSGSSGYDEYDFSYEPANYSLF